MPSNPYREQQLCFNQIHKLLTASLKDVKDGMNYNDLLRTILLTFAVSQTMIEKYIIKFYVDAGLVTLEDGILRYKK